MVYSISQLQYFYIYVLWAVLVSFYDLTRDGTVVSALAVSRLLLVFDYMVHLLSGESLHFKKLLQQVRELLTLNSFLPLLFTIRLTRIFLKEPSCLLSPVQLFLTTSPVHWRPTIEQCCLRLVQRGQLKMILIRNKRTRKQNLSRMW